MGLNQFRNLCFCLFPVFGVCTARSQSFGRIHPGFEGSPMNWLDHDGMFLVSNNSMFSLGFYKSLDVFSYALVVLHMNSSVAIWTANRGFMVNASGRFVFGGNGNVYLGVGGGSNGVVWSTNTSGKGISAMEMQDSGNLVLLDENEGIVWQSFSHPSDTLVPGQEFLPGMRLTSSPLHNTLYHYLEIVSGDLVLYAGYQTSQLYWSMSTETRKTNNTIDGKVHSVSLVSNSWNFYDQNRVLLSQFVFADGTDLNGFWVAVLGIDGVVSFKNLHNGKRVVSEMIKIPQDYCGVPERCDPYEVCSFEEQCQCPDKLKPFNCKPQTIPSCNSSISSSELTYVGEKLTYFAIRFVKPELKPNLNTCMEACLQNCSCIVLFFNTSSGECFLFDQIGSLQQADPGSSGFVSYMKESKNRDGETEASHKGKKSFMTLMFIVLATGIVIASLLYLGLWYHRRRQRPQESPEIALEDDNFMELGKLSGMAVRYSYSDLLKATTNFSIKIGEGGFGSVYLGKLSDETLVAVKKLEGKEEFRAEVSIIGSVHHIHVVKLKGYCAEGAHMLLVYEHMAKGSLDKWIFNNEKDHDRYLNWEARLKIAVNTAKGLAYLHEECEFKIIHNDIKPENILLDDNFNAKVSDFGLAKLMNRDASFVYTTMRGTRGYLAPEWITNFSISEKSDVYSYGLVLLEIIAGRKNCGGAFRMLEEGNVRDILDPKLRGYEDDESVVTAVKVALLCVQDEMHLRPSMTKVVQMLEGLCPVPQPPVASPADMKWSRGDGSSSGSTNSPVVVSGSRLSGPR